MRRVPSYASLYVGAWAVLLLVATPYIQRNNGGQGLSIPFNSTTWIVIALIITLSAFQTESRKKLFYTRFNVLSILVTGTLITPFFWSEAPWRGYVLDRYLAILAMGLLVLSWKQFQLSRKQLDALLLAIIAAGGIQAVLCLAQVFSADQLTWFRGPRLTGTMQQPNLVGSFIGTTLAVAIFQSSRGNKNRSAEALILMALVIGAWALVLVMSRTGLIGASLALVGMTFVAGWRSCVKGWLALSFGALLAVVTLSAEESSVRANLSDPGYREAIYSISLDLVSERPLTGHGMGKFQSVFMARQADDNAGYETRVVALTHPHNELLFWAVEGGLLPVLGFLILAVWVSWQTWTIGNDVNRAMWLAAIPILLHTQTELPFYMSTPHLALFALLISLADPGAIKYMRMREGVLVRLLATVMLCTTTLFMLTNLHAIKVLSNAARTPEVLTDIVNPFAQEQRINEILGEVLAQMDDPISLKQAETLALHEILIRPSALSYKILVDSLVGQNRLEEAAVALSAGKRLFPGFEPFNERAAELQEKAGNASN